MRSYKILPNNYVMYTCMPRDFYNAIEFANIEHRTICKWDTEGCSETTKKTIENDIYSNIENEYYIVNDDKKCLLEECIVTNYALGSGKFGQVMFGYLHLDSNARIQRIENERQWAFKLTEGNKENQTTYYNKYHRFHDAPNSYQLAYGGGWVEVAVKVFDFNSCHSLDDCIRQINDISREAYLMSYLQQTYTSMMTSSSSSIFPSSPPPPPPPPPPPASPSPSRELSVASSSASRSLPPSALENICASQVVQVYKTWYDDTRHVIYMALTKGDLTLGKYAKLREFQFTPFELISLMEQCLRGVHFMHQCQIVHCDIKPENILLLTPPSAQSKPKTPTSSPEKESQKRENDLAINITSTINTYDNTNSNEVIREASQERSTSESSEYYNNINDRYHQLMPRVLFTDFGLSHVVSDLVNNQSRIFGTLNFMPPECFAFYKSKSATSSTEKKKESNNTIADTNNMTSENEYKCKTSCLNAKEYFARDVWSLGCVFYYLLTGELAFNGNSMSAIQEQVMEGVQSITTYTEKEKINKEHVLCSTEQKEYKECCNKIAISHRTKNGTLHLSSTNQAKLHMPLCEVRNQLSEHNHQCYNIEQSTSLENNTNYIKDGEEEKEEKYIALQFVKQLVLYMLTMEVSHRPSAAHLISEIHKYKYKFVTQRNRFASLIYNWVRFSPEFLRLFVCQPYFLVPVFSQPVVQNDTFTKVQLCYHESVIVRRELVTFIEPTNASHDNRESCCLPVSVTVRSESTPLTSLTSEKIHWYEILFPIHGYCMKFMNGMRVFQPFEFPTVNSLESSQSSNELSISPRLSVERSTRGTTMCYNNNNTTNINTDKNDNDDDYLISIKSELLSPNLQDIPDVNNNG